MPTSRNYREIPGTDHPVIKRDKRLKLSAPKQQVRVTLILRRKKGAQPKELRDFVSKSASKLRRNLVQRDAYVAQNGADPKEIEQVEKFARSHGLKVLGSSAARRSVYVRGPVSALNKAFAIKLTDYQSPRGTYHSHPGKAKLPADIARYVEAIFGLHNRKVNAKRFIKRLLQNPNDPPNTGPLTPQQVAQLYNFPAGKGANQTIGIYEMETQDGPAGYRKQDIAATMKAFGGGLKVPAVIDVPVNGVTNSGVPDGETGLDITVSSAVAQGATIAVYFTGGDSQSIILALQQMIHPEGSEPKPSIISISYGWGADDPSADSFTPQTYTQIEKLFQDAANLSITVLVSSGDSGAFVESQTQAQTSYPASDPWVTSCGGTTIGNVKGANFDEYVWNDSGATGGGVSAKFQQVPAYQIGAGVPKRNRTKTIGRGVPDIAGNASPYSGYLQVDNGKKPEPIGGTSAVAPLYAGLIARVNANLGRPAGFLNPALYKLANKAFRDVSAPPGPATNSYNGVTGYPAGPGWDACTGLGSIDGTALQKGL